MKIINYSLGQLKTNCYFIIDNNDCLIIDPADEGSFILEEIQRKKLNPIGILATHGHFDHLMGVGEIQQSLNIDFYINEKDLFLLNRIKETAEHFLGYKPIILPIKNIKSIKNKDFLKIKNFRLKIIFTPGHTPGSTCFYFEKENFLFSGDLLFKKGIGRYDFSYSNKDELIKSIKKILQLPLKTIVYPGHGEITSLNDEKNYLNQLLKI